jgi:hypothetical protein
MTEEEADVVRASYGLKVTGRSVPHPARSFTDVGFPGVLSMLVLFFVLFES